MTIIDMDIAFKNRKLQKIFNSKKELVRAYGYENANCIRRRRDVFESAPSLAEVSTKPAERCHELKGRRKERRFAVDLKQPRRIVFKPNHDPVPMKKDGGIDLARVTAITILSVEDYH